MAKQKSRAKGLELGGLTDRFGYVIRRAQMAVFAEFAGMLKDLDLTPVQYSVLLLIGCNPGTSQRMICESLGILKSNFVALIHRFEERGLAERRPDGKDARTNALHLTRKGRALLKRADALSVLHNSRVAGAMGRERLAELVEMLQEVTRASLARQTA